MKHKLSPEKRSERIAEIVAEITSITEFAEGSISSAENKYRTKDGTVKNAKKRWRFQTKGARIFSFLPAHAKKNGTSIPIAYRLTPGRNRALARETDSARLNELRSAPSSATTSSQTFVHRPTLPTNCVISSDEAIPGKTD